MRAIPRITTPTRVLSLPASVMLVEMPISEALSQMGCGPEWALLPLVPKWAALGASLSWPQAVEDARKSRQAPWNSKESKQHRKKEKEARRCCFPTPAGGEGERGRGGTSLRSEPHGEPGLAFWLSSLDSRGQEDGVER